MIISEFSCIRLALFINPCCHQSIKATDWQSWWRRHVSWQQFRAPECKSCSLCSEWKTCFVLNQKALAGFPILLWLLCLCDSGSRSQTLTTTTLPNPKPPPSTSLSHFCPLAIQRGRFCWKQTTTNKRPKWGEECGRGCRGRTSVWNNCEEQFQTDVCLDLALGSCPR